MQNTLRAGQVVVIEKEAERSILKKKRQELLAKEAAKEKLLDDFMAFITAIENNDLDNVKNFDERAMMNTITTMMNGARDFLQETIMLKERPM
ncbi:hypothetical protein PTKIN_Ptkin01aG0367900 [Pterospermum kingtungense]